MNYDSAKRSEMGASFMQKTKRKIMLKKIIDAGHGKGDVESFISYAEAVGKRPEELFMQFMGNLREDLGEKGKSQGCTFRLHFMVQQ